MSQFFDAMPEAVQAFIRRQHVFFTASATADSRINLSPKGSDCLRVVSATQVVYLDQTGSGNETAAHIRTDGRLTIMFCAFEGADDPAPVWKRPRSAARIGGLRGPAGDRLRGPGTAGCAPDDRPGRGNGADLLRLFRPDHGVRGRSPTLRNWAERQGEDGIRAYWRKKNAATIDGIPTGILEDLAARSDRRLIEPGAASALHPAKHALQGALPCPTPCLSTATR